MFKFALCQQFIHWSLALNVIPLYSNQFCPQLIPLYDVIYLCILSFHLLIFVWLFQFRLTLIVSHFHSNSCSQQLVPSRDDLISLWILYLCFLYFDYFFNRAYLNTPLDYVYLLISIDILLLILLLFVQIAFCWKFVHWYLVLNITPSCSDSILPTIHFLI